MLKLVGTALLSLSLAACFGGSSGSSGTRATGNSVSSAGITTMGSRTALAQPYGASAGNANGVWVDYNPPFTHEGMVKLPTEFITLADGVRLAVSVTLPANAAGQVAAGTFPTVLVQTSYNLAMGDYAPAIGGADPFIVQHGYATVVVDVRGTGNSEGNWRAFGEEEQADYPQVVDWVISQPWSDGKVGVYGVSYLGITSMLTAASGHPAVKAAFPIVPIGDGYRDIVFTGGQVNPTFIPIWMALVTGLGLANTAAFEIDPAAGTQMLVNRVVSAATDFQVPTILNALIGSSDTAFDGAFWQTRSPIEQVEQINVPTFVVGGLHDLFQRSEPMWFERLKDRVPTKLLIGPWTHIESAGLPSDGLPADGVPLMNRLLLIWFDQYVKGLDVGADTLPNVTQYVKGLEKYVSTTDWPHPQVRADRLFLRGDKTLSRSAPISAEATALVPQQPLGGLCSLSLSQWTAGAAGLLPFPCFDDDTIDQTGTAVYAFTAEQDYYLNGPIQADIWIATTSLESSLSVRVSDYDPATGKSTPLSNGLLSASHRAVDESRSRKISGQMIQPWHPFTEAAKLTVTPMEPMLLPVEIFPTSALIKAGHELRISIGASNLAQGLQPVPSLVPGVAGAITIYNSPEYPSSVVFPAVPASALR